MGCDEKSIRIQSGYWKCPIELLTVPDFIGDAAIMPSRIHAAEVSDTTEVDSSNAAGNIYSV